MSRRPSEDELIARHLAPLAGPGGLGLRDDAALATPAFGHDLVVSTDMLVGGGHFFPDDPPDLIARKALRVNLSDLAAKGARPTGFLLGLGLPGDWTEPWLAAFVAGLADDGRLFACPLLGGDTIAMPEGGPLTLSITVFGEVPSGRMVPRAGTRAGDHLYVTGTIGDAALGLHLRWRREADRGWIDALGPEPAAALLARHRCPEPRLALSQALRANARAAMDVSDGLVGDLGKMLRLEGLTATIPASAVPTSPAVRTALAIDPSLLAPALTGGDDYEILCAVAPGSAGAFEAAAQATGVPLARLGTAAAGDGPVVVTDREGRPLPFSRASFQHFA